MSLPSPRNNPIRIVKSGRAAAEPSTGSPSSERSVSPRSSKGHRTRERLLEAAKEIFEEHGFWNARISDIAERAGQSHGSFYYYFDSKEAVFREVAAAIDDRLFAPLEDVIKARSSLTVQQRIEESMRRHFEFYRKEARMMGLIEHVANSDAEVNALRLARHQRINEQVAERIRGLQRRKLADPKLDPALTAAALAALTQRFAEMWLVHGAIECSADEAIQLCSRIFVNALRLEDAKPKS